MLNKIIHLKMYIPSIPKYQSVMARLLVHNSLAMALIRHKMISSRNNIKIYVNKISKIH